MFCWYFLLPQLLWSVSPFSALSRLLCHHQRSSGLNLHRQKLLRRHKNPTIIGSVTSDLRIGHKIYHHVAFQSLYTTSLETSLFDHPHIAMCWSKFRQNLPCASYVTEVASILLLPPGLLHTLHQVHVPHKPSLLLTRATHHMRQTADIIGHVSHS